MSAFWIMSSEEGSDFGMHKTCKDKGHAMMSCLMGTKGQAEIFITHMGSVQEVSQWER
jgi:hypothetical protein